MKKLISVLIMIVLLVTGSSLAQAEGESNKAAESRNGVVRILAVKNGGKTIGFGSGFAVGVAGEPTSVFATNQHVIEGAERVYILLDDEWYNEWNQDMNWGTLDADVEHIVKCEVVYTPDTYPDYAILQAERVITERVALPLMPAEQATPGEVIYALGFPGSSDWVDASGNDIVASERLASIDAMTVTMGTISRFTTVPKYGNAEVIQIDADINHGNSGGPLITSDGYVIGLNTWGFTEDDQMVEVALEIDYVISRLNNLIDIGKLNGFSFTVVSDRKAEKEPNYIVPIVVVSVVAVVLAVVLGVVLYRRKAAGKAVDKVAGKAAVKQADTVSRAKAYTAATADTFPKTVPAADEIGKTMPAYGMESYRLVCENGQFAGRRFALDRALRLGRDPQKNDLVFDPNTAGVSGVHCVLTPAAEGVALTDAGSSYGTFLKDGTKLAVNKSVILADGDSFYLGSQKQQFRIERKDA